jgi:beta-lactamase class A
MWYDKIMARKRYSIWLVRLIPVPIAILFFALGWLIAPHAAYPQSLRVPGYDFISPLLACNINDTGIKSEDGALHRAIQNIIDTHIATHDLSKASVYVSYFASGRWASVYPSQTFYPSSIGKIPIMMVYYTMADNDPTVLDERITYPGGPDLNLDQDIQPAEAIIAGKTYTIEQLIEYMIKDSDNNAAELLYDHLDQNTLQNIYDDLNIPIINNVTTANADAINPHQVAVLFRVLRNATYLSRDYSEKALQLLSRSSFTEGLVAGLPSSTVIAHKLGLVGIVSHGLTTEHELHDCGIVYGDHSYVICVMTRGTAGLPTMEEIISSISKTVYDHMR